MPNIENKNVENIEGDIISIDGKKTIKIQRRKQKTPKIEPSLIIINMSSKQVIYKMNLKVLRNKRIH